MKDDIEFWKRAFWCKNFSWIPRRSAVSGKLIWFTLAYEGIAIWTGPGEDAVESKWITKDEFFIETLKGNIY